MFLSFYAVPGAPPSPIEVSDISPTSAFFTWSPPSHDDQNGIIVLYVINVTVVETAEQFQLTAETNFLEVTSLRPFRTYLCVIAAATSVGVGPFSTSVTVETPMDGELYSDGNHKGQYCFVKHSFQWTIIGLSVC